MFHSLKLEAGTQTSLSRCCVMSDVTESFNPLSLKPPLVPEEFGTVFPV